jgi:hypothetical protein
MCSNSEGDSGGLIMLAVLLWLVLLLLLLLLWLWLVLLLLLLLHQRALHGDSHLSTMQQRNMAGMHLVCSQASQMTQMQHASQHSLLPSMLASEPWRPVELCGGNSQQRQQQRQQQQQWQGRVVPALRALGLAPMVVTVAMVVRMASCICCPRQPPTT